MNVWVGPIDDPDAAKPVTKDTKRGIRSYFWAYTNKHILYVQDADGDEDFNIYRKISRTTKRPTSHRSKKSAPKSKRSATDSPRKSSSDSTTVTPSTTTSIGSTWKPAKKN